MGNFLSILSGFTEGAGKTIAQQNKESRDAQEKNDEAVSTALLERLKSPDITPDEGNALLDEWGKKRKVKKEDLAGIKQGYGFLRQKHDDEMAQLAQSKPKTPSPSPVPTLGDIPAPGGAPSPETTPVTPNLPADQSLPVVPGAQMTVSANAGEAPSLGEVPAPPTPQSRNMGEIQAYRGAPLRAMATAEDLNKQTGLDEAKEQATRRMKNDESTDTVARVTKAEKDFKNGLISKQVYDGILLKEGFTPKGSTGASTWVPGVHTADEVKTMLTKKGADPEEINKVQPGYYTIAVDPSKTNIVNYIATKPNTYQGQESIGARWKTQFPKDMNGEPTDDHTLYYPVLTRAGGAPQGILPKDLINTTSVRKSWKTVQMQDGGEALVPVTETDESIKSPAGITPNTPVPSATPGSAVMPPGRATPTAAPGSPGPLGSIPSMPVNKPATRTAGSPITIPGAGRPLTPEQKQKNEQIGEQLNNSIGAIKDLMDPASQKILADTISSGKIQLQIDPHQGMWMSVINKNIPLSAEEARVAADWQLLTEGVLQMRIPMGGAGFRGPEGFGAIQSNKGIISQHPEIIQRVLNGTRREFRAQRNPLADNAKKYGYNMNPEMSIEDYRRQSGSQSTPTQLGPGSVIPSGPYKGKIIDTIDAQGNVHFK